MGRLGARTDAWEDAHVQVAEVSGGTPHTIPSRAALQPEWLSDAELIFADDPDGRWALQRITLDGVAPTGPARPFAPAGAPVDADTGYGLWVLGNRWYQPLDDGRIVAVRTNGRDEVVVIDADGGVSVIDFPGDGHVSIDAVDGNQGAPLGQRLSGDGGPVVRRHRIRRGHRRARWRAGRSGVDARVHPIEIEGPRGAVHAFAYPPASPDTSAPDDERAPYVVLVHGGPTAHVHRRGVRGDRFYTSRGIGVLDVNYGGSTGYGRAYRERLDGQWGVVDVDDVIAAARGLADAGLADPARIAIRGGSAGGWTVLSALVRGGAFAAGISRYGVADLRMLVAETHDFEASYIDGLVGPLPEYEHLYIERSPLTHNRSHRCARAAPAGWRGPRGSAVAVRSDPRCARDPRIDHEYVLYPPRGTASAARRRSSTPSNAS